MNYSVQNVRRKREKLLSSKQKIIKRIWVNVGYAVIILIITALLVFSFSMMGITRGLFDSAPAADELEIIPEGYATTILDSHQKQIQTLMGSDANREYVALTEIPLCVQQAFIAVEDARFYEHHGVDMKGIFRAIYSGISEESGITQGASTITQQLLKNQVFGGGNEKTFMAKLTRKLQEQYLAVQLENGMDKDQILEYYLNTINLGQNTLGVQTASKRYFNKDISQLNVSEAAVLAGIAKNPTEFNPITQPKNNSDRRKIVLKDMLEQHYISEEEYEDALGDDVYASIEKVNQKKSVVSDSVNSYYVDAVIDSVLEDLKQKLGYTETQAYNAIYRGGLKIYTCQNRSLQKICDDILNNDAYYPQGTKSYLSYYLSIQENDGTVNEYTENDLKDYYEQSGREISLYVEDEKQAKKYVKKFRRAKKLSGGIKREETIQLIKQPQASFVLIEQNTGEVKAIVGGRGDKMANRTLNRATASSRQPGSTFKILSTYLPALDSCKMTLATVEDDAAYRYSGTSTQVHNWNGEAYQGLTSLRKGIVNSMNIVTVRAFETVTPQTGFDYLQNLHFTTLVEERQSETGEIFSDLQLPMALGGLTDGVTNLELTAAYASIANGGEYNKPIFYTKVVDHNGNILLKNEQDSTRVMKESTAWLLTDAMKDVVREGTGKSVYFNVNDIALAGKTGTTSDNTDYWFEGYTPYYTAGIWTGYDSELSQEDGNFHKKIWKDIMERIHREKKYAERDFLKPKGIVKCQVCAKCGNLAVYGLCDEAGGGSAVRSEYFAGGTQPTKKCNCHVKYKICRSSGAMANANCPDSNCYYQVFLKKKENSETADTPYLVPERLKDYCSYH